MRNYTCTKVSHSNVGPPIQHYYESVRTKLYVTNNETEHNRLWFCIFRVSLNRFVRHDNSETSKRILRAQKCSVVKSV